MKKRIITSTLLLMLASASVKTAQAQIFILSDEEYHSSLRGNQSGNLPIIPGMDVTLDQYAPVGSGWLLLGCLGGAYLLGKRRKREE